MLLFCLAAVDLSGVNDKLAKNSYNKIKVNKKQLLILAKQQICTCITLFVHFFAVAARLQRESAYYNIARVLALYKSY